MHLLLCAQRHAAVQPLFKGALLQQELPSCGVVLPQEGMQHEKQAIQPQAQRA